MGRELMKVPHPYFQDSPFLFRKPPSSDLADLTTGLAGRPANRALGHDGCDRWAATQKIIEAAGLDPKTFGICPTCKGAGRLWPEGMSEETWERTHPP